MIKKLILTTLFAGQLLAQGAEFKPIFNGKDFNGSGGLWNNKASSKGRDPLVVADNPVGKWNHIFIRLVGDRVTVRLDDKLVVDEAHLQNYFNKGGPLPKTGPIQLQTHGAEIQWCNVMVKEL